MRARALTARAQKNFDRLSKSLSELPGVDTALTTLKAEFLAKNFTGEPEKVKNAHNIADTTDGELAKIKKAWPNKGVVILDVGSDASIGDVVNAMLAAQKHFDEFVLSEGAKVRWG